MAQHTMKISKSVVFMNWGYSVNVGYFNVPSPLISYNTDTESGHEKLFLF